MKQWMSNTINKSVPIHVILHRWSFKLFQQCVNNYLNRSCLRLVIWPDTNYNYKTNLCLYLSKLRLCNFVFGQAQIIIVNCPITLFLSKQRVFISPFFVWISSEPPYKMDTTSAYRQGMGHQWTINPASKDLSCQPAAKFMSITGIGQCCQT